ncbi:unnamed protein product, partial [Brassica oleracea var. botrytis]
FLIKEQLSQFDLNCEYDLFRRLNGLIRLSSHLLVERAKAKPTTLERYVRGAEIIIIYVVEFQINQLFLLSHRTVRPRTSPNLILEFL